MTYQETIEKLTNESAQLFEFYSEAEVWEAAKSFEYIGYQTTVMPKRGSFLLFLKVA